METNYGIAVRKGQDFLELNLTGQFDDALAKQLIRTLKDNSEGFERVFVRTRDLKAVQASGRNAFQRDIRRLENLRHRLVFTDENGIQIFPEFRDF